MTINTRWRENIYHPETLSGLSVPTQICILVHIHRPRISSWGSLCHVTICWISLVKSICKTVPAVAYYPFFFTCLEGQLNTVSANIYKVRSEVLIHFRQHRMHCWDFWLHTVQKKSGSLRSSKDWRHLRCIQTARLNPIFALSRLKPDGSFVLWTVWKQMKWDFFHFCCSNLWDGSIMWWTLNRAASFLDTQ